MPFSNKAGEGFENKLAGLIARELGAAVSFRWTDPSETDIDALQAGRCDAIMAVPSLAQNVGTTHPYYTSSYVFVARADRGLAIDSFKDHRLKALRIGVEAIDGGRVDTPPMRALAYRGLADREIAYPIPGLSPGGDERARIVEDVARGAIDLAVLWGPLGGYLAQRSPVSLSVTPITDTDEFSARKAHLEMMAFQYDISMAIKKGDAALREALDAAIARRKPEIEALLKRYGVPLVEPPEIAQISHNEAGR
jgi:quinoprotein dehydrogenase-associated probable ABC transporter substrate-binding protein